MPVWRARRSWGILLVSVLASVLATGLVACGGSADDESPPAAAEIDPPTRGPVDPSLPEPPLPPPETTPLAPEPPADPTPTDTDALAPAIAIPDRSAQADTPTPIEADLLPSIMPLTASATGPAVPLTGPILILSEAPGQVRSREKVYQGERYVSLQDRTSRVYLYDVSTDQYWTPFDYRHTTVVGTRTGNTTSSNLNIARSGIQPAGTHLIVWTDDQIHRVALTGHPEAMLFEAEEIRAVTVSPDGTHVAVLYGQPGTLVVLDAVSGAERLRVASDDPALEAFTVPLQMGNWHADGNALSIANRPPEFYDADTAILGLDGSIRVLPTDWDPLSSGQDWGLLSPDLRYFIRFGEFISPVPGSTPLWKQYLWDHWYVFDVESERLLWTLGDEFGIQGADRLPTWSDGSQYLGFHLPSTGDQVLDTATGERGALTAPIRQQMLGSVLNTCRRSAPWDLYGSPCAVLVDGRTVWDGAAGYWGRIDLPDGFALRGITPRDRAQRFPALPALPAPPARDAIVGPLFAYEVGTARDLSEDEYDNLILARSVGVIRRGLFSVPRTRQVIVYDEGTGASWSLFEYPASDWGGRAPLVRGAQGGLVASTRQGLVYISPDGQTEPLRGADGDPDGQLRGWEFQVSPDGRKVVALFDDRLVVFDLPSGDALLRVDDLIAVWEENTSREPHGSCAEPAVRRLQGYPSCYVAALNTVPLAWRPDSATILIRIGIRDGDFDWVGAGTVTLDGAIEFLNSRDHPDPLGPASVPRGRIDCRPDKPTHPCRILLDGEVVGEGRWPSIIGVIELD